MGDNREKAEVLVGEVDDDAIDELRETGYLRFQFRGDLIVRDPVIDLEYVDDREDD